jgi:excisionase family DNA binding protein
MADESLLTPDEVLDYLHLNLKTVYRLIKAGKLPAVRVGRQWRFRKADIDAFLAGSASAPAAPHDDRMPRRATVLVVDDEEPVRNLLGEALGMVPTYDVVRASGGAEALAILRATKVDVLVTDLRMPNMDGMTLIREARKILPDLAVIIITAVPSQSTAIDAIDLGVSGYLPKPFQLPKVLETVARALGPRD